MVWNTLFMNANMATICSGPHCSSDDTSELRKLPLGPGRWDGSVIVCESCCRAHAIERMECHYPPLKDWSELAVVKEKQNCDLTNISGLSKHTDS